jgi:Asp/Glu/hydantoin racemase
MPTRPRIVLLHATPIAIGPIQAAFAKLWPEAETINLLDDGLSIDRAKEAALSEQLIERFVTFGRYGYRTGAAGILVTCSAFGPAIDRLIGELPIPVIKPNEAMFRAALKVGDRIGMLATFGPSIGTMEAEFGEFVREQNSRATLTTILVDEAIDRLRKGDAETHNRLLAENAHRLDGMDAVMLAHFSTSIAATAVQAKTKSQVLAAPDLAVQYMRELVERGR